MNIVRNPSIVLVAALMLASSGLRAGDLCGSRPSGFRLSADAFVPNVGQVVSLTNEKVHFFASIDGGRVYFLDNKVAFVFDGYETDPRTGEEVQTYAYRTDLIFPGASAHPAIVPNETLPYAYHYYLSDFKAENVPAYASVAYRNLWPGVDLVFRLKDGTLKYDFVLAPGVSHNVVKIQYSDYQSLKINDDGQIVLTYPGGELREMAPVSCVLSERKGQKLCLEVESRYLMSSSGEISFDVKGRKKNNALIIDPLVRARATFYGGTSNDNLSAVVIDGENAVVAAGFTRSTNNYLTQNGYQPVQRGLSDVILVKFDENGARRWATFVGGPGDDAAYAIAADPLGNVYLTGSTRGNGYPEFNPTQTTGLGNEDVVISSFAPNGTIRFSTRFGGSNSDRGLGIAFDRLNNRVVVAGNTSSANLYEAANVYGGNRDGFVAVFSDEGGFLWSSYFGSERDDRANAVTVDAEGKIYVVGGTASNALPGIDGNYQSVNAGGTDAFLAVLGDDGQILRSTFFGGADLDEALSVALTPNRIAVAGRTRSANLPVSGDARQASNNGGGDGFFTLFDYELSGVPYSTYLGGAAADELTSVRAVGNRVYLAGRTLSTDFPVLVNDATPPNQSSNAGLEDALLAEFNLNGPSPSLVNAFYYGGARNDAALGLAAVTSYVAVVGTTRSINFPINFAQSPFNAFKGVEDGFLAVYNTGSCPPPAAIALAEYQAFCDSVRLRFSGGTAPYTVQILTPDSVLRSFESDLNGRIHFVNYGTGFYDLVSILDADLCVGDPNAEQGGFTFNADLLLSAGVDNVDNLLCAGDSMGTIEVSASGGTPPYTYEWTGPNGFVAFNEDISGLSAGIYVLTVRDAQGCTFVLSESVQSPEPLAAEVINNIVELNCANPTGELSANAIGGAGGYVFTWQGPNNFSAAGSTIIVSEGGAYTLFASDANGCAATASTLVSADFGNLSIDATTNATSCGAATDGRVIAVVTGGSAPYSVTLALQPNGDIYPLTSQNNNAYTFENLPAGQYRIRVVDADGCSRSILRDVLVGEGTLSINMGGGPVACFGDLTGTVNATVVGGTPPYIYAWTIQNGDTVSAGPGAPFSQLVNRPAGLYRVTVTDAAGCQKSGEFTVTQPDAPLSVNITTQANVQCFGQATGGLAITVAGGASEFNYYVSWTGPNNFTSTATAINGLQAGEYTALVTDINGCTATASATITQPSAPVTINLGQIVPSICGGSGGAILINPSGGVAPYTYQWSTGATTQNLSNVPAGQYFVVVRDANGCTVADTFLVNQLGTTLLATFTTPVDATCYDFNNGAVSIVAAGGQPPYQYAWRRNGQPVSLLGSSLVGIPGGNYSVTVTDAYGCSFEIPFIPVRQRSQIVIENVEITPPSCSGGGDAQIILANISGGNYPNENPNYRLSVAFADTVLNFEPVNVDIFVFNSGVAGLPIEAGTYTLTVVALSPDSCSRTWQIEIPQTEAFGVQAVRADATGCGPDNYGSLAVSPFGGTPDFSVRVYGLADNTYDVTLTVGLGETAPFTQIRPGFVAFRADNAEGCFVADTVFIGASDVPFDVEIELSTCTNSTDGKIRVSSANAVVYTLYRDNATVVETSPNAASYEFLNLDEGTYYILARDGDCFGAQIVELDFPEFEWQTQLTNPATCNHSFDGKILTLATGYNDIRYTVLDTNGTVVFPTQIGGVFEGVPAGIYIVRASRQSQPSCFIEYRDTVEYNIKLDILSVEPSIQSCSGAGAGSIYVEAVVNDSAQIIYYTLLENNEIVAGPQTNSWFIPVAPGNYTVRVGLDTTGVCYDEREAQVGIGTSLTLTLSDGVLIPVRCIAPYNYDSIIANLTINPEPSPVPNIDYTLYDENDSPIMTLGTALGLNYTFNDQNVTNYNNIEPGEYRVRATVADGLLAGCYAEAKLEIRPFISEPVEVSVSAVTPALACGYDNADGDASGAIAAMASGQSNNTSAEIWYRLESTDGFIVRLWQLGQDFENLLPANYVVRAAFFTGNPNDPEICDAGGGGCEDTTLVRVGIRKPRVLAPLNNAYSVTPTTGVAPYNDITTPNLGSNRARIYWRSDGGYEGGFAGEGGNPAPAGASNIYRISYRVVGSGSWQSVVVPNANLTNTVADGVVLWWELTGLQPQTMYEYRIQTRSCSSSVFTPAFTSTCGPQTDSTDVGGIFSEWATASNYRFTTGVSAACDTASYVEVQTDVVGGSNIVADVFWPGDQPNATCYILELRYEGSPTTLRRVATAFSGPGVQSYRFENLEDGTDYEVRVYTICGGPCPSTNVAPPPANTPNRTQIFTTPFFRMGQRSLSGFTVYPNPNKGEFTLSFDSQTEGTGTLSLTDVTGRTVFVRTHTVERGRNVFNVLENLSAGLYLVRFNFGDAVLIAKINVE